jgi:KipI family sensor histidine kinase inhibitor
MIKNISNLGDASVYCDFGFEVNKEINLKVISYFNYLTKFVKDNKAEGIVNLTPSYNKLIVSFDLNKTNYKKIKKIIESINIIETINKKSKNIKIPVCCDEKFALDLNNLSKRLKISKTEILDICFNKNYFCYMTGFIAGMPFLGDINEKIRADRLSTPRVKVPKGSIGITEQFCNIYTFESPGGWNIIGNTPVQIFNKLNLNNPALINPGDEVSLYKISKEEYINWNE